MEQTKLSELGEQFRTENVIKNTYLNSDGKKYNIQGTHPNALSYGDNRGRGTGGNSDSLNTINGGNDIDINGNPDYPGSGRNQLIARNESKYDTTLGPKGYGPNKTYIDYINGNNDTPTISQL
jgi:hypothetical protein